jgi:hypothetical protein
MLSTLNHPQLVAQSGELKAWLAACPQQAEFAELLKMAHWFNTKTKCTECGEKHMRHELRFDCWFPFAEDDSLICKDCFDVFCQPTMAQPKGMKVKWPAFLEYRDPEESNENVESAQYVVKRNGKDVGVVTHYNPIHHTGHMCFYGLENCAETGTLDQTCEVFNVDGVKISPDPVIMQDDLLGMGEIVYEANLDDILPH